MKSEILGRIYSKMEEVWNDKRFVFTSFSELRLMKEACYQLGYKLNADKHQRIINSLK